MMELIIDNFAGGGGASTGIEAALGRPVDYAINHDPHAIAIHRLNHPGTTHLCEDVFDVSPRRLCAGRPVGLAWFSPDCKHFSRAKGAAPRSKHIRGLAWVAVRWAREVRPRVIFLENVEEFKTWGPLDETGQPVKARSGETFRRWVDSLAALGYAVDWRELVAADYGAPTTRKRLFLIARCDGQAITWPEPTHMNRRRAGDLFDGSRLPWRTAAECIDWNLPVRSIFDRKRPLAEATLRRIAEGIRRYVIETPTPFIVDYYGAKRANDFRGGSIHAPLRTQTTENRFGLVVPFLATCNHSGDGFRGQALTNPMCTLTASRDAHALVIPFLTKFYGTSIGQDMRQPMPTITGAAAGGHMAEVRAFLIKYYGQGGQSQSLADPAHTITTKARLGLVTVAGVDLQIIDIGLRMFEPHELLVAQGFPRDYILTGSKARRVAMIGNSVPPPPVEAIVRANCGDLAASQAVA